MMNSSIKPCMSGLFSKEHLALQFLVPQTICKVLFHNQLSFSQFKQFCSSLIFIFLIIWTLDYPDYFVWCQRVQIIKIRLYPVILTFLGGWKRDMTELKFMQPVNTTSNSPKFILSPVLDAVVKNLSVTIQQNPWGLFSQQCGISVYL